MIAKFKKKDPGLTKVFAGSAVALTERVSADLAYGDGVAGGQKLSFHPIAKTY